MDAEKLFEKIQSGTGKNPTDIALVLDALITAVIEKTKSGQPVDFAEFGRFSFSEYSRIEFEVNQDFEKLINYRYNNSRPIVIDDGILPVETSAETLQEMPLAPVTADLLSELPVESEQVEETPVLTQLENEMAPAFPEPESANFPETDSFVTETAATETEPEPASGFEDFTAEPFVSSFTESEPEIISSQVDSADEPSPFIGEPEQIILPDEPVSEFSGFVPVTQEIQTPQSDFVSEMPSESVSEPGAVSEDGPPAEPVFSSESTESVSGSQPESQPAFSWNEPEQPAVTPTEGDQIKTDETSDGNTYQYQYLSHAELNKELDKWYIWVLIGLGVIALGAFIYWFMQGDVNKIKTAQKVQIVSDRKDSIVKQNAVNAVLDSIKKDSLTGKLVPALPAPTVTNEGDKGVPVEKTPVTAAPAKVMPDVKPPAKTVSEVKPAVKTPPVQTPEPKKETKPADKPKTVAPTLSTADGLKGTYDESKGGFTLNVASVPSADLAQKAVNSWKAKGYASGYKESVVNGKTIFRVRVGQFPTRAAALTAQEAFKSEVKDAWVDKIK